MPDLIPLRLQAQFAPTPEWEEEAKAILRLANDRKALLGMGVVVVHAAAGEEGS